MDVFTASFFEPSHARGSGRAFARGEIPVKSTVVALRTSLVAVADTDDRGGCPYTL